MILYFFFQKEETKEAFDLMQDVNPSLPAEYILKGIVYALIGQETNNVKIHTVNKIILLFLDFLHFRIHHRKNTWIQPSNIYI